MRSMFRARDPRVRRRVAAVLTWGALLLLVPLPAGAQDVCRLPSKAFETELESGADQIAGAYAKTKTSDLANMLSLRGGPCNWTCGSGRVITPMIHAFGLLQYNCTSTTAPSSTRLRTGPGTPNGLGLSITDDDYKKAADKIFRSGSTGIGDLMRVPRWLVDAAQDGRVKVLTAAVEAVPGAAWMTFSSTSVSNPPDGATRVIIRVPDSQKPPRFEQWIQIATDKKADKLGRNVDFLAVQLLPDAASPLKDGRPVVAFRGYSRAGFVPEGGNPSSLTKCYSCHPSGLRAVIPAPKGPGTAAGGSEGIEPKGTIPLTGPGNITELTNPDATKLSVLGPKGYAVLENGPPLGPSSRPNREQFVAKGCGKRLAAPRHAAIVANMNCEQCHDGETDRGILNAGTSVRTLYHKVVQNTVAPMPPLEIWDTKPSFKLVDPTEREVLFQCLQAEYAEILREWLTDARLLVP